MFKKILITTDGSALAAQAANAGIDFARSVGAQVIALSVIEPFVTTSAFDGLASGYGVDPVDIDEALAKNAAKYVSQIIERAKEAGVHAEPCVVSGFNVAEAIVNTAAEQGCDLIFIGSHGRSGFSRLLLGSVTAKILPLSTTAVLVYRAQDDKA
ncbi:universal stress protein [Verticiella sediminum]|uniref:Universal stress protein n=1 Tax=Verticiella sediminum TaxID=1247510 RepID=A0A556AUL0_9BURK|nr:universal stress protein [Verticiella sediminum]TSH96623.1 universal stress protein [Verticiella sediminum]